MTINVTIIKNNASPFSFQRDTWEEARLEVIRVAHDPLNGITNSKAPVFMSESSAKFPTLQHHTVRSIFDDNRKDGLTAGEKEDAQDARKQRAENFIRMEDSRLKYLERAIIDSLQATGDSTLGNLVKAAGRTDLCRETFDEVRDALTRLIKQGRVTPIGHHHYRAGS